MTEQVIINKTEKPNSLEHGVASHRHKIYYATPEELLEHINKLKELDLWSDEQ